MRSVRVLAIAAIVLVVVSPPAGATERATGPASRSAEATVKVFDDRLSPETARVPPISTVTWVNDGSRSHVVRSETGVWQTFRLQPGARDSVAFRTAGRFPYTVDGTLKGLIVVAGALTKGRKTHAGNYVYSITVIANTHSREWHLSYVSITHKVVPAEMRDSVSRWESVFRRVPIEVHRQGRIVIFGQAKGKARFQTTVNDTYGSGCQALFASPSYAASVDLSNGSVFPGETKARYPFVFESYADPPLADTFSCGAGAVGGIDPQVPGTSDPTIVWWVSNLEVRFAQKRGGRPPLSALASGRSFTMDSGLVTKTFGEDCNSGETCALGETRITVRFTRS